MNSLSVKMIFFLILVLVSACIDPDCKNASYDLETEVVVDPALKVYTLRDTITLEINVPPTIKNRVTDEYETIVDFRVGYEVSINKVDSVPDEIFGLDDTNDNINIFYKSDDVRTDFIPGSIYLTPKLQADKSYTTSMKFHFKKTGVYSMQFNGFTPEDIEFGGINLRDKIVLKDGCPKALYKVFNKINDGADNNLAILCETREDVCTVNHLLAYRDEAFDREGGYIFKVVE